MSGYVDCRCPSCNHKRGQAKEGSRIRIQCRQCRMFIEGIVRDGAFRVLSTHNYRRRIESATPPKYIG